MSGPDRNEEDPTISPRIRRAIEKEMALIEQSKQEARQILAAYGDPYTQREVNFMASQIYWLRRTR